MKHFVGTNYDSFFWRKMLSRICRELSRHVIGGLRAYEPPDTPARLLAEFPRMLSLVSKRRTGSQRCVVILDGVNQLFDEDHASNMKWIPATLPPHVRVIVATADGSESSKRMQAHVPPPVVNNINPLTVEECKELVRKSLAMHHKKLSEDAGDALLGDQVGAPSCCVSGNLARLPACMHTVLRVFGGKMLPCLFSCLLLPTCSAKSPVPHPPYHVSSPLFAACPEQMSLLLAKEDSCMPLYLLAVASELIKFGVYEQVTAFIQKIPQKFAALFDYVLDRLEVRL